MRMVPNALAAAQNISLAHFEPFVLTISPADWCERPETARAHNDNVAATWPMCGWNLTRR